MPVKSKGGPATKPAPAPKPKASHRASEAEGSAGNDDESSTFDSVRPQGKVADGKYDAVIREFVLQPKDAKGRSVRLKVVIADEGDYQGTEAVQFYKVFEVDGSAGKGAAYLKADLAKLGYEDARFADMERIFDEIVEQRTGILCTVKNNPPYTNVYVNALAEDSEVIAAFLATNPF